MDTAGRHILVECWGCPGALLDDEAQMAALLERAAEATGAKVVGTCLHRFSPQGVSGVVVIEESHLSVHTWPETGYAALDFYTCGDCVPERAIEVVRRGLQACEVEVLVIDRGQHRSPEAPRSIRISGHYTVEAPGG